MTLKERAQGSEKVQFTQLRSSENSDEYTQLTSASGSFLPENLLNFLLMWVTRKSRDAHLGPSMGFCLPGNTNRCKCLGYFMNLSSKYSLQKVLESGCVLFTKRHLVPLLQTCECPRKTEDTFCISLLPFTARSPSCPQLCIHKCLCYLQLLNGKMWLYILCRATVSSSENHWKSPLKLSLVQGYSGKAFKGSWHLRRSSLGWPWQPFRAD